MQLRTSRLVMGNTYRYIDIVIQYFFQKYTDSHFIVHVHHKVPLLQYYNTRIFSNTGCCSDLKLMIQAHARYRDSDK